MAPPMVRPILVCRNNSARTFRPPAELLSTFSLVISTWECICLSGKNGKSLNMTTQNPFKGHQMAQQIMGPMTICSNKLARTFKIPTGIVSPFSLAISTWTCLFSSGDNRSRSIRLSFSRIFDRHASDMGRSTLSEYCVHVASSALNSPVWAHINVKSPRY